MITTNLTSICCVYQEKIVKNVLHCTKNIASIQIQKVATCDSVRKIINWISNKSFMMLQPIDIDYFSMHLYIQRKKVVLSLHIKQITEIITIYAVKVYTSFNFSRTLPLSNLFVSEFLVIARSHNFSMVDIDINA